MYPFYDGGRRVTVPEADMEGCGELYGVEGTPWVPQEDEEDATRGEASRRVVLDDDEDEDDDEEEDDDASSDI